MCFPNFYKNNTLCKLGWFEQDSLDNCFNCAVIDSNIFETEDKQKEAVYKADKSQGFSPG